MRTYFLSLLPLLLVALSACHTVHVGDQDGGPTTGDGGDVVQCGRVTCDPGLVCCNASCGICTAPGLDCAAIACEDTCASNADCTADAYCAFASGSCGGADGVCQPRPDACPPTIREVCGCDGATYSTACDAAGSGVNVARDGACSAACGAQDARGEGACDALLGVVWDGQRCETIGGCDCVGADCGDIYGVDEEDRCWSDHAACTSCAAQDADVGRPMDAHLHGIASEGADTEPDLLERLRALLWDRDPSRRQRGCLAAGEIGSRMLLEDVLERLDDEQAEVRAAAGAALAHRSDRRVLRDGLVELLRASEPRLSRLRAVDAIGRAAEPRLVPALIERLDDPELARAARRALVRLTARDEGPTARDWWEWYTANADRPRPAWLTDALLQDTRLFRRIAARDLAEHFDVGSLEHLVDAPAQKRETARRQFLEALAGQRSPASRAA